MRSREEMLAAFDDRYALFGLLFAFGNQLQIAGDSFYEGITCKQFFFLICLNLFGEEHPTINELSEVMGSSHQNVKQMAVKLEKNGLLRLIPDEADKRKLRIVKTDKIAEFGKRYAGKEMEFMEQFYAGVSEEELATTYRIMKILESNLTQIRAAGESYEET